MEIAVNDGTLTVDDFLLKIGDIPPEWGDPDSYQRTLVDVEPHIREGLATLSEIRIAYISPADARWSGDAQDGIVEDRFVNDTPDGKVSRTKRLLRMAGFGHRFMEEAGGKAAGGVWICAVALPKVDLSKLVFVQIDSRRDAPRIVECSADIVVDEVRYLWSRPSKASLWSPLITMPIGTPSPGDYDYLGATIGAYDRRFTSHLEQMAQTYHWAIQRAEARIRYDRATSE